MTGNELAVALACTVLGYTVVSWVLKRNEEPDRSADDVARRERQPRDDERPSSRSPPLRPSAQTWHQVLGVPPNATRADITSAYRALISQYHPDKVARLGSEIRAVAERKSAEINRAYEQARAAQPPFP